MAEPHIDRQIALHFMGDWGQANLHRACGWIGMQMCERAGAGSRFAIWNGRGFVDNVLAVANREVDMAISTPATFVRAALDGRGPYRGQAHPNLRAIAQLPQNDRLLFAIHPDAGVSSFAELREKRVPLRIATSPDDGVSHVGMAAQRMMEQHGMPRATLEGWGGAYIEAEQPQACHALIRRGEANAIIHEAIMTDPWQELVRQGWRFLDMDPAALHALETQFGWEEDDLPAGYYPNQEHDQHVLG
ncbi:MAG: hypothetical protein JO247_21670, partial [Chloroflexi bacterium]|nr:hypothetical protein [Chloroflexota bacterium]